MQRSSFSCSSHNICNAPPSAAQVLQIVIDRSLPKPGELERNVIRPSRSLTRTRARTRKNNFPAPTPNRRGDKDPSLRGHVTPRIHKSQKNVLEGMVQESRVRPPHPPPLPTPSPGGDVGGPVPAEAPTAQLPLPRRRLVAATRQRPRSVPWPGTVTGRRPLTVTTPPTAVNGLVHFWCIWCG